MNTKKVHLRDGRSEEQTLSITRALQLGPGLLSDSAVLGVVMGLNAQDAATASRLVTRSGGLKAFALSTPLELSRRPGIGRGRALKVACALELARRVQQSQEHRPRLRTPEEIYAYLQPILSALRREVFHVLCFNTRNVLLADFRVAEGTVDMCPVDPREVYASALSLRASAVVFAHNHPSGDPEPSVSDINLTAQLVEAGRILGIRVLDHLIVGDGTWLSLAERGHLPSAVGKPQPGQWNST